MRILILSEWFQPEPIFKGLPLCKELVARGHEVEVLTGFPNYPGGKIYPGYRLRLFQREEMSGVRVNRVWLYPSHDKSGAKRFLTYGSFAFMASLLGPWLVRKPDVVYVYHPPGTIGLPAALLRLLKRAPSVYDIQDMWPDTIASSGMMSNSRLVRVVGRFMKWVYRRVDRIVVLSPGFKKLLIERGVPAEKIRVIYNWCEDVPESPYRFLPEEHGIDGEFSVLFAGTMGVSQGLDAVLDAAEIVSQADSGVRVVFVGGGIDRERLEAAAIERKIPNVRFVPKQPIENMPPILASADALLVHLRDDPLFEVTIPSKTQAYLAAGRPIVMAVRGDAASLVCEAEAGVVCEPSNPESIARAILELARMPKGQREQLGENGRQFYEERLSIHKGAEAFEQLFEEVAGRR